MSSNDNVTRRNPPCDRCGANKSLHPGTGPACYSFRRRAEDMPRDGVSPYSSVRLGLYQHHKGGRYEVTGGTLDASASYDRVLVAYRSVEHGYRAARDIGDFLESVDRDGESVPRFRWIGAMILLVCLALPAAARAQSPQAVNEPSDVKFMRGREHWDHYEAWGPLKPKFGGFSSFDVSIEPGSTRERRAAMIFHISPANNDMLVTDTRNHDVRAIDTGKGWFQIAGLPAGLIGADENMMLAPPVQPGWRAKGRIVVRKNDGTLVREFGILRFRMGHTSIDSPDPAKPAHGPMVEEEEPAANDPVAQPPDDSPRFTPGRESWHHFNSWGPLRPLFHGASSFDLSIDPGHDDAPDRRADLVLLIPGTSREIGSHEWRHHDCRAVMVGAGRYRIEGLPASLVGPGETVTFTPPQGEDRRATGPLVIAGADGTVARRFGMHPVRVSERTIDSPDPVPQRRTSSR